MLLFILFQPKIQLSEIRNAWNNVMYKTKDDADLRKTKKDEHSQRN